MSIVTKDYCACGKRFDEENEDCVFNYHKKIQNTKSISLSEIINCGWCNSLVRLDRLEKHTDQHHKGANVWID